jgi:lipoprotein-anchoring transpeptidase ErfK/SrfK
MSNDIESSKSALKKARHAFKRGDKQKARYWAQEAVSQSPDNEDAWLWLASVSEPRASVAYFNQALEVNPKSTRARNGMHWAVQRLRATEVPLLPRRDIVEESIPSYHLIRHRSFLKLSILPLATSLIVIFVLMIVWISSPLFSSLGVKAFSGDSPLLFAQVGLNKATRTPTPTYTPTATFTPSPTLTPTNTPTPLPTNTPEPTSTPEPTDTPVVNYNPAPVINVSSRWIDVNLSEQRTYAYDGNQLIRSFIVSTGTWQHPTVTGQYRVYVKYVSAPMSGPGYYLPNVPYIMYFYRGYGLHGTYWHNNFGTPMSHGCINLTIPDSEWLYNWASVGTLVNIHY